ncbi:hypothetical protein L2E82_34786 [Cichorium intybus]|uniref:Uncharacterized protein n=1 Tax=Cichorium intybus TaxID=13427 RepID=A0ACB9BMP6_CICIN|nr:hypothetical protein L2E82_34786 [Cichorium intybus]
MEVSLIYNTVTTIDNKRHNHGLGFATFLIRRHSLVISSSDQQQPLEICAQMLPIDAVAPWSSDPTFDPVYEALTWFVLSNSLHFALKRVVQLVADPGERRF